MLMFVIQHQPHRAGTDLRRVLVACLLAHGSTFSRVGASGKPGAVQERDKMAASKRNGLWGGGPAPPGYAAPPQERGAVPAEAAGAATTLAASLHAADTRP